MPKAEFGTPKWMSNRIKASGLQKLRWYCQMCQKQCRDENGFKCHRMSEGHQRAMQLFIQRPGQFMDEFSREFEDEFMKLMKTRYCRTRVLANTVYNNVVCDRHHIHMNATIWVTLSEFVQYLGATDKCKIEHTPKGWYVEYIDHEELARKKEEERKRKVEKSQEEARREHIQALVEEAKQRGAFRKPEYTPLQRENGQLIALSFTKQHKESRDKINALEQLYKQMKHGREGNSDRQPEKRKLSAMEALAVEAEHREQRAALGESSDSFEQSHALSSSKRRNMAQKGDTEGACDSSHLTPPPHKHAGADWWIRPGIVVKAMHKTLGEGQYYKQKGVVKSVDGRYSAVLEMLEGGAILKLDQEYLETVIPPIGGRICVVLGMWRGHEGRLERLDIDSYSAKVTLDSGPLFKLQQYKNASGVPVEGLPYEHICKLHRQK
ncbi:DNA/RNA-binding protein KIN17 [Cyclospora cayetanensis]|nr:DNA/RNA-binding protein KIN17 [Cyclospora cayetanensis]